MSIAKLFKKLAMLSIGCLLFCQIHADELRPAYLELSQVTTDDWQVYWKVSHPSTLSQFGKLVLPDICSEQSIQTHIVDGNRQIHESQLRCNASLHGHPLTVSGLSLTNTDVLVHIIPLTHETQTSRLSPKQESMRISYKNEDTPDVFVVYFKLGIEHILKGYDHVFFVLGMVLLLQAWRPLLWTISAFTFSHSVTLIGSTLGYLSLSPRPVEAIIALSIVFLAYEVLRLQKHQTSLSLQMPWLVALIFGLLHGFGFAGALADIGLPADAIPLALLSFNLGVEFGQILIVVTALLVLAVCRFINHALYTFFRTLLAYLLGSIASFWCLERVLL